MSEEYRYLMAYGALVGRSHGTKIPCQDSAICVQRNGVSAAVLSDGCGSAPLSEHGSKVTVESVSNFLVDNFDELVANGFEAKGQATIATKKRLVEEIVHKMLDHVKEDPTPFENYKNNNIEKYNKYRERHSEEAYLLSLMHATLIFYAEKGGKAIIGQIGDGFLGAVIDDKMRLFLEEDKIPGAKNATFYPDNIYEFAVTSPEGDQWYLHRSYKMGLVNGSRFNGVMLTSDGVESFFVKTRYSKTYAKVDILFDKLIAASSFEERQAIVNESYLPRLVAGSPSFDDCSLAILVDPKCKINEYIPKEYPHDPEDEEDASEKKEEVKKPEPQKDDPTKREIKVEQVSKSEVALTEEEKKLVEEVNQAYGRDYTSNFIALKKKAIENGDEAFVSEYLKTYHEFLLTIKTTKVLTITIHSGQKERRRSNIYRAIKAVDKRVEAKLSKYTYKF